MTKEEYQKKLETLKALLHGPFAKKDRDDLYRLFKGLEKVSLSNNFRRDSFTFSQGFEGCGDAIQTIYVDESNIDSILEIVSEGLKSYPRTDMGFSFACNFIELEKKDEPISFKFIQSVIEIRDLFKDATWTKEQWEKVSDIVRDIYVNHGAVYTSAKFFLNFGTTPIYIDEKTMEEVLPLLKEVAKGEKGADLLTSIKHAEFGVMDENIGNGPLSNVLHYVLFRNRSVPFDEVKSMLGEEVVDDLTEEEPIVVEEEEVKAEEAEKGDPDAAGAEEPELEPEPEPVSEDTYDKKLIQLQEKVKTMKYRLSCNSAHRAVLLSCLGKLAAISSRGASSVSDDINVKYKLGESKRWKIITLPINSGTIDEVMKALEELEEAFKEKEEIKGDISFSCEASFIQNKLCSIDKIAKVKNVRGAVLLAKITSFENLVGYVFDNGQVLFESVNYGENPDVYHISSSDLKELIGTDGFTPSMILTSDKTKKIERFLPTWTTLIGSRGVLKKNSDGKATSDELVSLLKEKGITIEETVVEAAAAAEPSEEIPRVIVSGDGYILNGEKLTKEKLETLKDGDPPVTKLLLVIGDEEKEITIDKLLSTFDVRVEEATEESSLDKTSLEYKKILEDRIKRCKEIISKLQAEKHKTDSTEIRIRGYQVEIQKLEQMLRDFKGKKVSGVASLLGSVREGLIEKETEKQNTNLATLKGKEIRFGLAKKFNERNIKSVEGRIERLKKLDGFCGSIQRSLMCPRTMLAKLGRYSEVVGGAQFYQEKVAENKEYKELLGEHKWRIFSRLAANIQGVFYKWNASRYKYLMDKLTDDSNIIQYGGSQVISLLRGTYKHEEIESAAEEALGR